MSRRPEGRRPGEALEVYVERQIREAQERGELDRLPCAGRPLPFADRPHDPMRWWREKLEREKLSVVPESISVRREAERVLASLPGTPSERLVRDRLEALNARIRKVNRTAAEGPPTSLAPLDVEAAVERWRRRRELVEESDELLEPGGRREVGAARGDPGSSPSREGRARGPRGG